MNIEILLLSDLQIREQKPKISGIVPYKFLDELGFTRSNVVQVSNMRGTKYFKVR